jgi:hypothetical protein
MKLFYLCREKKEPKNAILHIEDYEITLKNYIDMYTKELKAVQETKQMHLDFRDEIFKIIGILFDRRYRGIDHEEIRLTREEPFKTKNFSAYLDYEDELVICTNGDSSIRVFRVKILWNGTVTIDSLRCKKYYEFSSDELWRFRA